ncbi:hypothetical protein E2C01_063702 [Portunus trituberculatus]|uniref:Uncharacterized protein n=1 Tax=Portunus trituberculatus TaxID=210409 RepID=A0A5B7HHS8_PORTR|nr:hypothetical protein [Portunus trituberculatus]
MKVQETRGKVEARRGAAGVAAGGLKEKVEGVFDGGYESVRNKRTYGTRSPVVESSYRLSNPTINGKIRTLDENDDDNDDDDDVLQVVSGFLAAWSSRNDRPSPHS